MQYLNRNGEIFLKLDMVTHLLSIRNMTLIYSSIKIHR
jgi:hypothetical protein